MKNHMLLLCLTTMLPWLAQADEAQDFYNFTFHGSVAGNGLAPVLTITFGKNAK